MKAAPFQQNKKQQKDMLTLSFDNNDGFPRNMHACTYEAGTYTRAYHALYVHAGSDTRPTPLFGDVLQHELTGSMAVSAPHESNAI